MRLFHWAKQYGNSVEKFIHTMIEARTITQQAFRACLGVLRLGKQYGPTRLENAFLRALLKSSIALSN